jgi:predicted tellurium resistance membrane protein TerC
MEALLTSEGLIALLTLTVLEIVLGIDNVIFISILAARLPLPQQGRARQIGMLLALFVRIGLLFSISWIVSLKEDLFSVAGFGFSGRDLILLGGGLFLIGKTVTEIHHKLEGEDETELGTTSKSASFTGIVIQIVLIDIVFSFDSILTAVGLSRQLAIMVVAVIISIGIMMFFAGAISRFIEAHPTIKILALSFLVMIGFLLVIEAFDVHVDKGFVYFAMAFALGVEGLNITIRKRSKKPVHLKDEHLGGN